MTQAARITLHAAAAIDPETMTREVRNWTVEIAHIIRDLPPGDRETALCANVIAAGGTWIERKGALSCQIALGGISSGPQDTIAEAVEVWTDCALRFDRHRREGRRA